MSKQIYLVLEDTDLVGVYSAMNAQTVKEELEDEGYSLESLKILNVNEAAIEI